MLSSGRFWSVAGVVKKENGRRQASLRAAWSEVRAGPIPNLARAADTAQGPRELRG